MHKHMRILLLLILSCLLLAPLKKAMAAPDRQSFFGFGPGVAFLSQEGSGAGFYVQGFGGYSFDSMVGVGLHLGYSNVGGVGVRFFDFGGFLQLTEADSGLYGRFYLDGVNASTRGAGLRHGVTDSETGFAPGVGLGMLIPAAGDFHLVPELTYRMAFLTKAVNLITPTFSVMWDF